MSEQSEEYCVGDVRRKRKAAEPPRKPPTPHCPWEAHCILDLCAGGVVVDGKGRRYALVPEARYKELLALADKAIGLD